MNNEKNSKTLPSLFLQCFLMSMVTFGGGSTIIALLQKNFVEKLKWINESEMLELVALAQSSLGATSVNTTMLVGYKLFGLSGAVVCATASILPPLVVITIITPFYEIICSSQIAANALNGVRACAAALVTSVSLSLAISLCKNKDYFSIAIWICVMLAAIVFVGKVYGSKIDLVALVIFVVSFILIFRFKFNPVTIIFVSAIMGIVVYPLIK